MIYFKKGSREMAEQNESAPPENAIEGPSSDRREFLAKVAVAAGGVAAGGLLVAGLNQDAEAAPVLSTNPSPLQVLSGTKVSLQLIDDENAKGAEITVESAHLSGILAQEGLIPEDLKDTTYILKVAQVLYNKR